MKTMKLVVLLMILTISSSSSSLLPHFFPNISSIPLTNITTAWNSLQTLAGSHLGDTKPGISKLKSYFQYFGYLNNITTTTNFTDHFDDFLQTALKTYQHNFNLNSTGQLDPDTLKQILRPRCGVPDIINGTSSMNSGKPGTVAHYSFFPNSPRWPSSKTELKYAFLPENQLDESVKAVFGTAFDRWSEITPLTFTETREMVDADITIGFYSGDHNDGEAFDGMLGTLGHAFAPPNGRLHLDGDEDWVMNGEIVRTAALTAVDLETVVVHEIGHLLGLGHSSVEAAVMFPSVSPGMRKVELGGDDTEGIQALYGPNPNYNGSESPTLQKTDGNNGVGFVGPHSEYFLFLFLIFSQLFFYV